jgi:hypothetical protein
MPLKFGHGKDFFHKELQRHKNYKYQLEKAIEKLGEEIENKLKKDGQQVGRKGLDKSRMERTYSVRPK